MNEWLNILRLRMRALWKRRELDRDLADELEFHLSMKQASDNRDRPFGNRTLVRENMREIWTFHALETWWQDIRFAARLLRHSPVFSWTAVLSLAIGIGANTAIFSVADALMLKKLPVRNPEQLRVVTWSSSPEADMPFHSYDGECHQGKGDRNCGSFSYPAFRTIASLPQFSNVIGFSNLDLTVTAQGTTEMAFGHLVSGDYFTSLGVKPLLGRIILGDDDKAIRPLVGAISYGYWTRRFGQDPAIVGRKILVNNRPLEIAGVIPRDFLGLYPGNGADVYVPMGKSEAIGAKSYLLDRPDYWWVRIFARLKPAVADAEARAAIDAAFQHQVQSYSGKNVAKISRIEIEPGARGLSLLRDEIALQIYVLAAAVALVLLIACANLANLLLARGSARRREIAVRLSVGAGRMRLLRQLLTEGVLLSLTGGVLGIALASPLMQLLLSMNREHPLLINAALDTRAVSFALCVSVLTGLSFSAIPALRATRLDLSPALKDGALAGSGTSPRLRLGRLLVAGQVALSLLLLIVAGLFVRTLVSLHAVNLGFNTENLLTFRTDPSLNGMQEQALAKLYSDLRESIEQIPGVHSVALSRHGLIEGSESSDDVRIAGAPLKQSYQNDHVFLHFCSSSLLSTLQIPVLRGRDLLPSDAGNAQRVAIVNRVFARKYFPDGRAIGKEFYLGDTPKQQAESPPVQIVGVSEDAHYTDVRSDPPPTAYLPYLQYVRSLGQMTFFIRTALPPLSLAGQVRKAVARVDKSVPVGNLHTERQQVEMSLGSERMFAGLVSWLGLVAALLAAVGLYGVVNYAVARRTAEIGIRLALGADQRQVLWLVMRESMWLVAAGLIIGIPAALALTSLLGTMLYKTRPADALTYTAAGLLMFAISAVAAFIPARRASKIPPVTALKYE